MVRQINGDLLVYPANLLCHQVNYFGFMHSGIAASIREKALSKESFSEYVTMCKDHGRSLISSIQILPYDGMRYQYIVNMFSQDDVCPDAFGSVTSYSAIHQCLIKVQRYARKNKCTVALPGYIGCGIAGGDWSRVLQIIHNTFDDSPVTCTIVYKA